MQVPGPTLIVNEGDTVTVNLTNNCECGRQHINPVPGFQWYRPADDGLLTKEAAPGAP